MFGMLWRNATLDVAQRVHEAARYYERKYGLLAVVAWVNPAEISTLDGIVDGQAMVEGVRVMPSRLVARGHVLVGVEQ